MVSTHHAHHDYYDASPRHLHHRWTINIPQTVGSISPTWVQPAALARSRPVKKSKRGLHQSPPVLSLPPVPNSAPPRTYLNAQTVTLSDATAAQLFSIRSMGPLRHVRRRVQRSNIPCHHRQSSKRLRPSPPSEFLPPAPSPPHPMSSRPRPPRPRSPRLPELTSPPKRYPGQHNFRCAHFLHARRTTPTAASALHVPIHRPPERQCTTTIKAIGHRFRLLRQQRFRGHLHHQHQRFRCN